MARRGSFGHLPKAAPDLTSTLVSIARQMQNTRDQNVYDAWKNGGLFEGKPVTDEDLLAYYNQRLTEYDPSDPDYDTYKNNVLHLEYNIAQSKADLAYKQGKLSDNGMAQFYLNWAKKVPVNSEFYRSLQKDAAQFLEAASAKGRAAAAQASEDAYQAAVGRLLGQGQVASILTQEMTDYAKTGTMDTPAALVGESEKDLSYLKLAGENDPGKMLNYLNDLNSRLKAKDPSLKGFVAAMKAADPTWNGQVTMAYWKAAIAKQADGLQAAAAIAGKTKGHKDDASKYAGALSDVLQTGVIVGATPALEAYNSAYTHWRSIMDDPTASDDEKTDASQAYAKTLTGIAATKGLDQKIAFAILNDAKAAAGDESAGQNPTVYQTAYGIRSDMSPMGTSGSDGTKKNWTNADIAADQKRRNDLADAAAAHPDQYVYATTDGKGNFDPNGKSVGLVTADQVAAVKFGVVYTTRTGGKPVPTFVAIHTITLQSGAQQQGFGQTVSWWDGGAQHRLYGLPTGPNGTLVWTAVAPWAPGARENADSKGNLTVDVADRTPKPGTPGAAPLGGKMTTHAATQSEPYQVVQYSSKDGNVTSTTTYGHFSAAGAFVADGNSWTQPGDAYTDEAGNVIGNTGTTGGATVTPTGDLSRWAVSATRVSSGSLWGDSPTMTVASLTQMTGSDANTAMNDMNANPAMRAVLLNEEMSQAAGMAGTADQNDPRFIQAFTQVHKANSDALTIAGAAPGSLRDTDKSLGQMSTADALLQAGMARYNGVAAQFDYIPPGGTAGYRGHNVPVGAGAGQFGANENPLAPVVREGPNATGYRGHMITIGVPIKVPGLPPDERAGAAATGGNPWQQVGGVGPTITTNPTSKPTGVPTVTPDKGMTPDTTDLTLDTGLRRMNPTTTRRIAF